MGPPTLFPIRRKVCFGFLSLLIYIAMARFEPATFGSSGKHIKLNTLNYTTEATRIRWCLGLQLVKAIIYT
jgi:hypothetical protein